MTLTIIVGLNYNSYNIFPLVIGFDSGLRI